MALAEDEVKGRDPRRWCGWPGAAEVETDGRTEEGETLAPEPRRSPQSTKVLTTDGDGDDPPAASATATDPAVDLEHSLQQGHHDRPDEREGGGGATRARSLCVTLCQLQRITPIHRAEE
jgi:hypothetical protein